MTTGAVIFAFDSEIPYTKLAIECAERIQHFLDIPVTLITNHPTDNMVFEREIVVDAGKDTNRRWFADRQASTVWYNFGRNAVRDLTPYDRTLLVDCDYMVNSPVLKSLLESTQPMLCHRHVHSVQKPSMRLQKFGTKNTDLWWATVVVFDRDNDFVKDVFSVWKMVEQNYSHYAALFGFNSKQFRNDYALSIALLVCNGNVHPGQCEIPWPLCNIDTELEVSNVNNVWWIEYTHENRKQKICVKNHDLHVMGKSYLEKLYAA